MIFPEDNMQERFYNIVYFLNKYGLKFIDYIESKINVYSFEHQLIDIIFQRLNSAPRRKIKLFLSLYWKIKL